jgi:tetratricopeptide (TPR) repeat protein
VYVLCLLPVSNFAAQYHPIADRYLYAPLAGLGLVAAALTHRLFANYRHGPFPVAIASILLSLLALEYAANLRRQRIWQQPGNLWSDVLQQYPGSAQALLGMANVHYRAGDFPAARTAATEAVVSSKGLWADAWAVRATCEWQDGAREQSLSSLQQAQRISRAYRDKQALEAAMVLSPQQVVVFEEIVAAP